MRSLDVITTRVMLRSLRPRGRMPTAQCAVMAMLSLHPRRIISHKELVDWMYADDPDGGPETAASVVSVIVHRLRRRGAHIAVHGHRGYSYEPPDEGPLARLMAGR